tara:strand:- start:6618 stop:7223 length:606 start_codon:yes stop_codon:yes gene_type:complete
MKNLSKIVSSIFHPLFTPILGVLCYFKITPKYHTLNVLSGNILPVFILTVIVPIVCFLILRNIGVVTSYDLPTIKERKYPFYINLALLFMVLYKVIPNNYTEELFYFFLGLITATFSSAVLLLFKFKSSMHLMGMGTLVMFLINLSIHFEINIVFAIAIGILSTGVVASARLYLRAHTTSEIIIGFLIGAVSQLITIKYWL